MDAETKAMATEALGRRKLTIVDRFGAYLSLAPIRRVVGRYDRPSVLDIGCGYRAHVLQGLSPLLSRGVGIDESVGDEAKAHANLSFHEAPAQEVLPRLESESFDVVMMISVLEHLWEPVDALRACHRLARPGGSVVVNVPNWAGKTFLETSAFRLRLSTADSIDDHKAYYSKRDLWPLLVRAGFKPSRIRMRYHKLGLNTFAVAQR
jgi:SAM-dependent methyltransferase